MRNLEPNIWPIPVLLPLLLELGAIRGNKWDGARGRLTSRREEEAEEEEEGLNLPAINHRNFVVVVVAGSLLCSLRPKLFPSPSPPQFGVSPKPYSLYDNGSRTYVSRTLWQPVSAREVGLCCLLLNAENPTSQPNQVTHVSVVLLFVDRQMIYSHCHQAKEK